MHASVRAYVAGQVAGRNLATADVLEVGSRDVNGTVRDLFHAGYWGVDVMDGPGVDQVVPPGGPYGRPGRAGVVLCLEVLEHDVDPGATLAGAAECLAKGGVLIVTCRGWERDRAWPTHTWPVDLWRFSPTGVRVLVERAGLVVDDLRPDPGGPGVLCTAHRP